MIGINVHWNSVSVTSETEEKRALNFACKRCPLQRRRVERCSVSTIERALGQLFYNPA